MPLRVTCPHCRTLCVVAEQHRGMTVKCGRCGRSFTTRGESAVRLDLAAASNSTEPFLVHQLSWCNLDERHELAVLAIGDASDDAGLTLLLSRVWEGTVAGLATAVVAALPAATVVVGIGDGQVHVRQGGEGRVYHQRAGRLTAVVAPFQLAAGDGLVAIRAGVDTARLQTAITQTSDALSLADRLAEGGATAIVVRCL